MISRLTHYRKNLENNYFCHFGLKSSKNLVLNSFKCIWAKEDKINDGKDRKRERRDSPRKCKIRNSAENSNVPVFKTNNKQGRKPGRIYKVTARKCKTLSREKDAKEAKNQVRKEEIRVKLKLVDTCLMIALTYGIDA